MMDSPTERCPYNVVEIKSARPSLTACLRVAWAETECLFIHLQAMFHFRLSVPPAFCGADGMRVRGALPSSWVALLAAASLLLPPP